MTKRQMIVEQIIAINRTATAEFLDQFDQADLENYLRHLEDLRQPRLMGNCRRYEKYFTKAVAPAAQTLVQAIPALTDVPALAPVAVAEPERTPAPAETLFAVTEARDSANIEMSQPEPVAEPIARTVFAPAVAVEAVAEEPKIVEVEQVAASVAAAPIAQPVELASPAPAQPRKAPAIAEPVYSVVEEDIPQEVADVFYEDIATFDAPSPAEEEQPILTSSKARPQMELAGAPAGRNASKSSSRKDDNDSFLF